MREMRIYGFTTKRMLSADDVRRMCINRDFYTRGDTRAYENLLNEVSKNSDDVSDAFLIWAAEDIFDHSDIERMCREYGCSEEECLKEILFDLIITSREVIDKFETR